MNLLRKIGLAHVVCWVIGHNECCRKETAFTRITHCRRCGMVNTEMSY